MRVFVATYTRCGGTIVCEALGQHSKLTILNEDKNWQEKSEGSGDFVIKPFPHQIKGLDLVKKYPGAKFIFIRRNVLDICASFKKREESGKNPKEWLCYMGEIPGPIYITAAQEYKEFLKWLKRFEDQDNVKIINFNCIINAKYKIFEEIINWLGLKMEENVLDYITKYISDYPITEYPGQALSYSPKKKINSYKDVLTSREIIKIQKIMSSTILS